MTRIKQMNTDMGPARIGPVHRSVRLSGVDATRRENLIGKLMAGERSGFVVDLDREGFMKGLHDQWAAWILKQ